MNFQPPLSRQMPLPIPREVGEGVRVKTYFLPTFGYIGKFIRRGNCLLLSAGFKYRNIYLKRFIIVVYKMPRWSTSDWVHRTSTSREEN